MALYSCTHRHKSPATSVGDSRRESEAATHHNRENEVKKGGHQAECEAKIEDGTEIREAEAGR